MTMAEEEWKNRGRQRSGTACHHHDIEKLVRARFHYGIPTGMEKSRGFFAKLTRRRLKRGVLRSVIDLQVAINRFVAETNVDPKPLRLTADPKSVLAAVKRGKQTLESVY
jgi:hypothetical protein